MNNVAGFQCTYCGIEFECATAWICLFDRLFVDSTTFQNPIPYIAQYVYYFTTLFIIKSAENADNQLLISV